MRSPAILAFVAMSLMAALSSFGQTCVNGNCFQVGGHDTDGALIVSVGPLTNAPTVAPALPQAVAEIAAMSVPVSESGTFRAAFTSAIESARSKGQISLMQAAKLRVALLSPAFVSRARDLAVIEGFSSGAIPPAVQPSNIDWNALADFLERVVPIILEMLKLFNVL